MDTNNTTVVQVHRSAVSDEHEDDDDSRSIASVDPLVQNKQPVDSQLYTVLDSLNNGMNNNNALLEKLISALKPNMPSGNSESSTNSRKRENNAELSSDTPAPKRAKPAPKTGQNVHGNDHETRISSDVLSLYAGSEDEDGDASEGEITEQTTSDNDFLSEISDNLFASDDYGPPIAEKLAKIANKNLETELDLEKLKAIIKSYKRPENCEQLYVPRINPEIMGQSNKKQPEK